MAEQTLVSFVNVKLGIKAKGDSKFTTTQCILSIDGLGSKRDVSKKKCLNDKTLLSVKAKEYDTLQFTLPFSEESLSFHEKATLQYDANKPASFEIEFDNKLTDSGKGTTISGTGYITGYTPKNDDDAVVSEFTLDWAGAPMSTKAS